MTAVIDTEKFQGREISLCRFTNGRLKEDDSCRLKNKLLCRPGDEIKDQKILVSESPVMTYTGQNFGRKSLNPGSKGMKYYVGVYDEKRGKMRICDAQLFQMSPYIPGQEEVPNIPPATPKGPQYREKLSMLTEAFGSKKRKSALEKLRRNKLDDDKMEDNLAADIDHGKQQVKTRQANMTQDIPDGSLDTVTPPCNKEAEDVEDVYKLSDILTDSDLDALHGPAAVFFDSTDDQISTWKIEEKYPKYVLKHMQAMPKDPELRWNRSKCLMYLYYMMSLYKKQRKDFRSRDFHPKGCPGIIQKKLNENFTKTVNSLRCIPSRQKDRLACFIVTLCLLINEFHINLTDLMTDMGLQRDKMFQIVKILGCRINKKDKDGVTTYVARLKLPLDFPSRPLFKRGGRR